MSEERPRFAHWRYPFAGIEGKKILLIEFFQSYHFHRKVRHGKPVYPSVLDKDQVDWSKMYRVRVNGKWFGPKSYSFFTMVEMAEIVERILERESIMLLDNNKDKC